MTKEHLLKERMRVEGYLHSLNNMIEFYDKFGYPEDEMEEPKKLDFKTAKMIIENALSDEPEINWLKIKSKTRKREISDDRAATVYAIFKVLPVSLKSVGKIIGNRDHSTIIHNKNKYQALSPDNPRMKHVCKIVRRNVKEEMSKLL